MVAFVENRPVVVIGHDLDEPSRLAFVIAHETPTDRGPGSLAIEEAVRLRPMPVTLRMFGHFHTYRHLEANAIVVGNAGAPLSTVTFMRSSAFRYASANGTARMLPRTYALGLA